MMRKTIAATLSLILLLSFSSCSIQNNIEEETPVSTEVYINSVLSIDDIDYSFIENNYSEFLADTKGNLERNKEMYEQIVNICNEYRKEKNLPQLTLDNSLTVIASIRAEEIAENKSFSHTRPNNKGYFSTLFNEYGYSEGKAGENIGWGYSTADEVCKAWKESTTHYENIINSDYTKIGIGIATYKDGTYVFTQEFMA